MPEKGRSSLGMLPLLVLVVALWGIFSQQARIRYSSSRLGAPSSSFERSVLSSKSAFPSSLHDPRNDLKSSVAAHAYCLPKGIHLSQANNVQSDGKLNITVSFMLDFDYCGHAKPQVVYGRGFLSEGCVPGTNPLQFNYTSKLTDGLYQSDFIYHVEIPDLSAGRQVYWYKIVVQEECPKDRNPQIFFISGDSLCRQTETEVHTFWTPPLGGQPTTLALIGDLGQTENSTKTMAHIWHASKTDNRFVQNPVTQLLIVGDLSYADSDSSRWPSWFATMEPLLRSTLLHVAAGNHEIECNTETLDVFVPYEHYFRVPNRLGNADLEPITDDYRRTFWNGECHGPSDFEGHYLYGNSFYAYTHGLAKVIVLNSYTDTRINSTQYLFLERELQLANRERDVTPWLIVAFHSPLYTTFRGHVNEGESVRMRVAMEPLFLDYKVNLIVSGHDHAYMRTHPMYNGNVVPDGRAPIYLTLGAGGNREQHAPGYRNTKPESWVAKRDISEYGYGHLFLPNATHCRLTWVRDGTTTMGEHDSVWIRNPHRVVAHRNGVAVSTEETSVFKTD